MKKIFIIFLLLNFISFSAWSGVNLDGTNDYIDLGDVTTFDGATALTIIHWVKRDDLAVTDAIVRKWAAGQQSFFLIIDDSDFNEFQMAINDAEQDDALRVRSTDADMTTGVWYCLAGVWSGANNIAMYKNGSPVSTAIAEDNNPTSIANTSERLLFGAKWDAGTPVQFINGIINDVKIYKSALSATQIAADYNSKLKYYLHDNPDGYWPLDDHPHNNTADSANGLVFKDLSVNGNDGTAVECNAQAEEILSYPPQVQGWQ